MGDVHSEAREALARAREVARKAAAPVCLIGACEKPVSVFQLCRTHVAQAEARGAAIAVRGADPGRCAMKECPQEPANRSAFCVPHGGFLEAIEEGTLLAEADALYDRKPRAIPIDSIVPGPLQMRIDPDPEAIDSLARSLARRQLAPILVVDLGNGKYELVYGYRRWMAAKTIPGKKTLLAVVLPKGTPKADLLACAHDENFQRELVSPFEKAMWIAEQVAGGTDQRAVAQAIGLSEEAVSRQLAALKKAHEQVLAALRDRRISFKVAYRLIQLEPAGQLEPLRRALAVSPEKAPEAARKAVEEAKEAKFKAWVQKHPGYDFEKTGRGKVRVCHDIEGIPGLRRFYWRFVQR